MLDTITFNVAGEDTIRRLVKKRAAKMIQQRSDDALLQMINTGRVLADHIVDDTDEGWETTKDVIVQAQNDQPATDAESVPDTNAS